MSHCDYPSTGQDWFLPPILDAIGDLTWTAIFARCHTIVYMNQKEDLRALQLFACQTTGILRGLGLVASNRKTLK